MKQLSIFCLLLLLTNNDRWHCEGSNYVSTELPRNCSWNSKSEEYDGIFMKEKDVIGMK